jgi:hypothetical protein
MKLPNADKVQVPEAKIIGYLLSFVHEDGRSKAAFFTRFGFSASEWRVLALALTEHARDHAVIKVEESPFGTRYVIEGVIHAPDGRSPEVRSIWFIETEDTTPRFVTAYPLRRKS